MRWNIYYNLVSIFIYFLFGTEPLSIPIEGDDAAKNIHYTKQAQPGQKVRNRKFVIFEYKFFLHNVSFYLTIDSY